MPHIEIDAETYRFLESKAIAFVESPGDTIKRLLGIAGDEITNDEVKVKNNNLSNDVLMPKKKKTNLPQLIRAGMLQEGQRLIFQDYRGNQYPEHEVVLYKAMLKWEGQLYSMSDLAKRLLKKKGYTNEYVRGPIFWVTSEGKTIAALWDQYLQTNR